MMYGKRKKSSSKKVQRKSLLKNLDLDVVGDSRAIRKLGQTRIVYTRLQNVCIKNTNTRGQNQRVGFFITSVSPINIRKRCD